MTITFSFQTIQIPLHRIIKREREKVVLDGRVAGRREVFAVSNGDKVLGNSDEIKKNFERKIF